MSEPVTHYDANDGHTYTMHDVVEPPEFGEAKTPAELLFDLVWYGQVGSYQEPAFQKQLNKCVQFYSDRPF